MSLTLRLVDNEHCSSAFKWHRSFADRHDAIYPRDFSYFTSLVYERSVWCAVTDDGTYHAMSYAAANSTEDEWEIGGLMVSDEMRGKGLGSLMMRLPLCHLLIMEQPLSKSPPIPIVTHILAGNKAPRNIIPAVGFKHAKSVEIAAGQLPGLKADEDGFVRGDEFHFDACQALLGLAAWCDGWRSKLSDGTPATIDLLQGMTLENWAAAFRGMHTQANSA